MEDGTGVIGVLAKDHANRAVGISAVQNGISVAGRVHPGREEPFGVCGCGNDLAHITVGAYAKFATDGKTTRKKDLAAMAMTYGDVYVAQIAMGADYNQTLRAILEAESYHGPSLIIAYSPCINHGIKSGMGSSQQDESKAVKTDYWHLFRYNPSLKEQGINPFILDSKAPSLDYEEFLKGETRYTALQKTAPENAKELFEQAKADAAKRYERLVRLREFYEP
jgi:pyruvate-ferredoxin/flavodoxin oxidoreductase